MVPYMRYFTYPARRVLSWSCLLILTETAYDDWLIAMTPLTDPPPRNSATKSVLQAYSQLFKES